MRKHIGYNTYLSLLQRHEEYQRTIVENNLSKGFRAAICCKPKTLEEAVFQIHLCLHRQAFQVKLIAKLDYFRVVKAFPFESVIS